jgi:hypothetical protein
VREWLHHHWSPSKAWKEMVPCRYANTHR